MRAAFVPKQCKRASSFDVRRRHNAVIRRADGGDSPVIGRRRFAVLMAVRRRRPKSTLIHSDQGTQYGSDAWRRFCRSNHLEPSMSRKDNCWNNAVAESFFSSLRKERVKRQLYRTRELAITDLTDYIENFYNRTRRRSHPGGVSPEQCETAHKAQRKGLHWELQIVLSEVVVSFPAIGKHSPMNVKKWYREKSDPCDKHGCTR